MESELVSCCPQVCFTKILYLAMVSKWNSGAAHDLPLFLFFLFFFFSHSTPKTRSQQIWNLLFTFIYMNKKKRNIFNFGISAFCPSIFLLSQIYWSLRRKGREDHQWEYMVYLAQRLTSSQLHATNSTIYLANHKFCMIMYHKLNNYAFDIGESIILYSILFSFFVSFLFFFFSSHTNYETSPENL